MSGKEATSEMWALTGLIARSKVANVAISASRSVVKLGTAGLTCGIWPLDISGHVQDTQQPPPSPRVGPVVTPRHRPLGPS